jgi:glycosyltransferase involved in cell wall biosynthesis
MAKIIVIGSYAPSLINFRGHLLKEMIKRGHEVLACAPDASHDVQEKLKALGVTYRNIPIDRTGLNPVSDIYTICRLISLFREVKPDVILGYTIKPVVYGSIAAKIAKVPHIYSMIEGLGYVFFNYGLRVRLLKTLVSFLYRIGLKSNKKIFFLNIDDLEVFLSENVLKDSSKVSIINGTGIDYDYYLQEPLPDKISFLLIARLLKDKGILEYIEAAKIIKGKFPDIEFKLAGNFDSNPECITEAELHSWISQGLINYMGYLPDVRPAIADASVYVLPSYHEGTPRTVLEAMSMGRPVITTDAPGCRETVQEGRNGFLVPVRNAETLAERMERFIEHPELIARMGKESRRIAIEKYDVRKVNAVILEAMGP